MNFKKIMLCNLLVLHAIMEPSEIEKKEDTTIAIPGFVGVGLLVCAGIVWARSGDSVHDRIYDAQQALEDMPELEQNLDVDFLQSNETESEILQTLERYGIDSINFYDTYKNKVPQQIKILQENYNNLWFKSFYGGQEIIDTIKKVEQYQKQAQSLLNYLEQHHLFMYAIIMFDKFTQAHPDELQNINEIMTIAQSNNNESAYPVYSYTKTLEKYLIAIIECLANKNFVKNYPELLKKTNDFIPKIARARNMLLASEKYKEEALAKIEHDITLLTEQYQKMEKTIKQLQVDVAIAKMR